MAVVVVVCLWCMMTRSAANDAGENPMAMLLRLRHRQLLCMHLATMQHFDIFSKRCSAHSIQVWI